MAVDTVTAFVPRDPNTCWRAFTDARKLTSWVPGLRHADILSKARGFAAEVHFQLEGERAYTLIYAYDADKREVSWQPKIGPAQGVTGFARFDATEGGSQITYGIEHGKARSEVDQALAEPRTLVAAFVAYVERNY